jgi:hypothetical protein
MEDNESEIRNLFWTDEPRQLKEDDTTSQFIWKKDKYGRDVLVERHPIKPSNVTPFRKG